MAEHRFQKRSLKFQKPTCIIQLTSLSGHELVTPTSKLVTLNLIQGRLLFNSAHKNEMLNQAHLPSLFSMTDIAKTIS